MAYLLELIDSVKAQAIAELLNPTEDWVWRKYCRQYSKVFNTPLHQVFDLNPELVFLAVIENQFEGVDLEEHVEELLESIYMIEDPNYEAIKKKELQDVDRQIEEEEEARLRAGKPIHPAMKNETVLPTAPKSGSISLSHLEESDSKGGGFD